MLGTLVLVLLVDGAGRGGVVGLWDEVQRGSLGCVSCVCGLWIVASVGSCGGEERRAMDSVRRRSRVRVSCLSVYYIIS